MEKSTLDLKEQFCWQIKRATGHGLMHMDENLRNDLKYRNDSNEKLECIKSNLIEIRNKLEGSGYNYQFPPDAIDNNLVECLGKHFDTFSMSEATHIVYDGSIKLGKYDYNRNTKVLTVRPLAYFQKLEHGFAFSHLDVFKPLISHIELCQFFLELIRLDKEFKEEIKAEESKLLLTSSHANENVDNQEMYLDYSENNYAERIVFLSELGILDFLRDKMNKEMGLGAFNANKLAEVVSAFTNVVQTTGQSYLNPIFSKDVDQEKNPLTPKNIEKVKKKLMKIGFHTTKSDISIK